MSLFRIWLYVAFMAFTLPAFAHVFGLFSDSTKQWVYTAQNLEAREELMSYIVRDYIINLIFVNVVVIFIAALGVIYELRPLRHFSRILATRGADNLNDIDVSFCDELVPIKANVNLLLGRIKKSLAQEKAFNADVSHELRTPLAAIKIHGQNIQNQELLSASGQHAVQRILDSIDSMTQIIEQLLLLDGLDSELTGTAQIDLYGMAKQVVASLPEAMHDTHIIELIGAPAYIQGHVALLSILMRNLIENAVKYSPKGTRVVLAISSSRQKVVFDVVDQGPGMTLEQKSNALRRHYRVSDSQSYGSGLGLSIVHKIVNLHGGQTSFLDNDVGLTVRIVF